MSVRFLNMTTWQPSPSTAFVTPSLALQETFSKTFVLFDFIVPMA